jgi:hypothetical protein
VRAQQYDWNLARGNLRSTIAAKRVPEEDSVILRRIDLINAFLNPAAHAHTTQVVESFRKEFDVDQVGRARDAGAHLPKKNLTANQLQPHERILGGKDANLNIF